jgi:hypothetical protein
MKQKRINEIGTWAAILSFLIGTIFLLIFYLSGSANIAFTAYLFVLIAGILNLGILLTLIVKSITDKENRKSYLRTSGVMLLNIPIVIMYFYFVMVLINTMRIEFINETGKQITAIKISGCEPKTIDKLDLNESETSWVGITGDCSINIEYNINIEGRTKTENVFGYVTSFMGQKATYRIGNQKKPLTKHSD